MKAPAAAEPQLQYTNVAKRDAASGAINIILFDLLNTPRSDLLYARKQLLEFLKKLPPGQSVALFVLTDTLHMVQNFTGSSDRLLAAAQSINPDDMSFIRSKDEAMQDDDFISYFAQSIGYDPGGAADKFKAAEGNQEAIRQDNRGYMTVAALAELARATSGYPGRKNLLWLSEDFPVSVGAQITDPRFRRGTADLAQARETANLIADAQISVYPISLLGLQESGIPSSSSGMGSVSGIGGPSGSTAHPQMGDTNQNQFSARSDLRFATTIWPIKPAAKRLWEPMTLPEPCAAACWMAPTITPSLTVLPTRSGTTSSARFMWSLWERAARSTIAAVILRMPMRTLPPTV